MCQWTRFHFLSAKSKTSGLVRASVIVDLLWPLAQRGPDQIGHFDQNLIGCNGVIPSSAGYGLHMTPNKNHMLLSVKTDALMDVSERTPLDGPRDGRRAAKHRIAMRPLGSLHTAPPSEGPYVELSPPPTLPS